MRLSEALLVCLATLAPLASAVPVFSAPAAGASLPGGSAITVTWKDDGTVPSLTAFTSSQLLLYSGSSSSPVSLTSLVTTTTGLTATVNVPVAIGGSTTNAYFFGLLSTATAGGTLTTFSSRFTLTGMTGTFPVAVIQGNEAVTDTAPPPSVNALAGAANPAASSADAGAWGIPYPSQTGLTKYAPMQPVPPTAITKTVTTPQWPTSSVVLVSTFMPIPSVVTTLTQSQTFSVSSHANTAAAQSSPTDDMQRFLNRWKD